MVKLNYCIMVTGSAYGSQRSRIALRFSKELVSFGHSISSVFFYREGVLNANYLNTPSDNEFDCTEEWFIFSKEHSINLYVCISAAINRGIIDSIQSKILNKDQYNLHYGFKLSSLFTLVQEILICDRFLQF